MHIRKSNLKITNTTSLIRGVLVVQPVKLEITSEVQLTWEHLHQFIPANILVLTKPQQIIERNTSLHSGQADKRSACGTLRAWCVSAQNKSVFAAAGGGTTWLLFEARAKKFSGLANTVGEITWQTKYNRLTRYANTRAFIQQTPFYVDSLWDRCLLPLNWGEAINFRL